MEWIEPIRKFMREDDGVTAIEYALVASLIALAIVTAAGDLGGKIANSFTYIKDKLVS